MLSCTWMLRSLFDASALDRSKDYKTETKIYSYWWRKPQTGETMMFLGLSRLCCDRYRSSITHLVELSTYSSLGHQIGFVSSLEFVFRRFCFPLFLSSFCLFSWLCASVAFCPISVSLIIVHWRCMMFPRQVIRFRLDLYSAFEDVVPLQLLTVFLRYWSILK